MRVEGGELGECITAFRHAGPLRRDRSLRQWQHAVPIRAQILARMRREPDRPARNREAGDGEPGARLGTLGITARSIRAIRLMRAIDSLHPPALSHRPYPTRAR